MSLISLSSELLASILSFEDVLDRHDLFNVFMTCRRLNLITLPFLYRSMQIMYSGPRGSSPHALENILAHFNRYPERLIWVKKVHACWYRQDARRSTALFELLFKFSAMQRLRMYATGPWDEDLPFQAFLNNCHECTSIQHLNIANVASDSSEAIRLFAMPYLESLVFRNFQVPLGSADLPSQSYNPTKLKEMIVPLATCLPMGPHADLLLQNHPFLRTLVRTVTCDHSPPVSYPSAILRAMAPLLPFLENLTLLMREPSASYKANQMDFSGFTALKYLEIHEKLTFGNNFRMVPPETLFHRNDLPDRLPRALRNLIIWFGRQSRALHLEQSGPLSYSWLLHLARQKKLLFENLARIKLLEEMEWQYHKRPRAADTEWDYPSDDLVFPFYPHVLA
ncbi:hypothetical protein ONS95_006848 [Cadophora gregata]|uniref:uncharacterized protein n=1 Tax=Cadophora gregata TaxID=51156 RepID=UPI0026DB636B|nr:uncharacterized protein ONS95_006848 [Cadophora gregata]KAK0101692.1 hypothetical protein ONS95_006848 [Cadophora gregata]